MEGHAKARYGRRNKAVIPLAGKLGDARVSKNKYRGRRNLENEEKLDSFDVAASFKNRRSRDVTDLERDRASYWRRTHVALSELYKSTETKYSHVSSGQSTQYCAGKIRREGASLRREGVL